MFDPRSRPSFALTGVLALAACQPSSSSGLPPPLDGAGQIIGLPGPSAGDAGAPVDARGVQDAWNDPADAGGGTGDAGGPGGDAGVSGSVSCYSDGFPDTTCALPTHCCFSNYNAQHSGACMTSACTWGTIECDGPEDCAGGQHCCAHALIDPVNGTTGYLLACQASACGPAPANQELCHPASSPAGTCSGGRTCVSAADHDYDLPRTLDICQ